MHGMEGRFWHAAPIQLTAPLHRPPGRTGPSVGSGPIMEKRNIFGLFRIWLKRQGGQAALKALIQSADGTAAGAGAGQEQPEGGGGGGAGASGDGKLDLYEVQKLLRKVTVPLSH